MKKMVLAASAAMAAAMMAPSAQAATIACPTAGSQFCTIDPLTTGNYGDSFESAIVGFSDIFNFTAASTGILQINGSFIPANGFPTLNGALWDNVANVSLGAFTFNSGITNFNVTGGTAYSIRVGGTANAGASYSGQVSLLPPVPEPATWAMMVAGIAAVGTMMRRRSYTARVAFS